MVDVVAVAHLGLTDNRRIGDTSPADITAFVRDELGMTDADAVFISCTNLRAVEALDAVRDVLGVPVTSSNDATVLAVRERLAATV